MYDRPSRLEPAYYTALVEEFLQADPTRLPSIYDEIAGFLQACGIPEVNTANEKQALVAPV